jgi:hypothetical protein
MRECCEPALAACIEKSFTVDLVPFCRRSSAHWFAQIFAKDKSKSRSGSSQATPGACD